MKARGWNGEGGNEGKVRYLVFLLLHFACLGFLEGRYQMGVGDPEEALAENMIHCLV